VNDRFFDDKPYSEIRKADVRVNLILTKHSEMMILDFTLAGAVNVPCDRCGDSFNLPVQGTQHLVVKLNTEPGGESDEAVSLPASETEIDVSPYICEYINLVVPLKREHATESDCNPEVLKTLDKLSHKEEKTDPRWEELKKLKFK
jgi:uncharacterized metal-binding protein YceD (DUF177 family)